MVTCRTTSGGVTSFPLTEKRNNCKESCEVSALSGARTIETGVNIATYLLVSSFSSDATNAQASR